MSIYQYPSSSAISQIQFRYTNDHPPEALLTASSFARPELLSDLRATLGARGWQNVAVSVNGTQQLQVSGFDKTEDLLELLNAHGYSKNAPKVTAEPNDHPVENQKEWMKRSSLKLSGWSYIIGDIALILSGIKSGRKGEQLSGGFSLAGAGVLTQYGNVKTEHHVRDVTERMGTFLEEQACQLPESCALSRIIHEKKQGRLQDADQFLTKFPSETALSLYALSALSFAQSGIRHKKPWDVAASMSSFAASMGSVIMPEKKVQKHADAEHALSEGQIESWKQWIQEKPLRVAGFVYLLSGAALGMSAMREMKNDPKQKSYIFKFIAAGSYILGNAMLMISNKSAANGHGAFDADEKRRILGHAAEAISTQPEVLQKGLVGYVSGFLAQQPEMGSNAPEISKALHEQLEHFKQSPWVARTENAIQTSETGTTQHY